MSVKDYNLLYSEDSIQGNNYSSLDSAFKLQPKMEFIEEVLDLNPFAYQIWYCKGKALMQQGRYQEALESFDFAHVSRLGRRPPHRRKTLPRGASLTSRTCGSPR